MRMLHCPLRRPLNASRRLPGRAKSPRRVAASSWSSFREAVRAKPENAATRRPPVARLGLPVGEADDHDVFRFRSNRIV